jgi:hypothetical protein
MSNNKNLISTDASNLDYSKYICMDIILLQIVRAIFT